jgi:hypothetical protein
MQYQREAVDVLYAWAVAPQVKEAPSTKLVPSEPIVEPARPTADASLADWHEYYVRMAAVLEWQMEVEAWRGGIEDRLEGLEAITGLIPDILERLPAPTITPAHQNKVKYYVSQLSQATGQHPARIYSALYTVFNVPRYQELLEAQWEQVERWFRAQLGREGYHFQQEKRKEAIDEQPYEQTEKASFTQAGKHRAVLFAICDVALLDAVLCG